MTGQGLNFGGNVNIKAITILDTITKYKSIGQFICKHWRESIVEHAPYKLQVCKFVAQGHRKCMDPCTEFIRMQLRGRKEESQYMVESLRIPAKRA